MTNRRVAIQQLFFLCAGTAFLPACFRNGKQPSISLKKIKITVEQENMLADLAEIILPKTDTPGAKDLSAHLFALKMVDDCFSKNKQEKFITALGDFESLAREKSGKSFTDRSQEQKMDIVRSMDEQEQGGSILESFYLPFKQLVVEAYSTSQFYLTNIRHYKMIPGRFQGCVPLKAA